MVIAVSVKALKFASMIIVGVGGVEMRVAPLVALDSVRHTECEDDRTTVEVLVGLS